MYCSIIIKITIIIFSGHLATFKKVSKLLKENNITFGTFNNVIKSTLDDFNNNIISVILLETENNGAGIEIPKASDIILFHQMRNCLESQAIARAQRPGRENQLTVWKLKYSHEY